MFDAELEALLDDIESDRAERKESASDGEKIRQVICAFANDLPDHREPSVLFVGVDDKGKPVGLSITDQMLQNLASMRGDGNILPFPSLDVQKRRLKGHDVAVVIVHPSNAPPVRFKGTVYIRSGPRRGIANPDDERRLNEKRRFRDLPVDIRPLKDAGLDTIDELLYRRTYLPCSVASEVIEQNQRSLESQLAASKFVHLGPPACPTVLGILTVGKSPTDWVPGAYVQFLRIDGTALGDPVKNQKEIRGPLPDLLDELEDLLKNNIQSSADFTSGPVETNQPDYPIVALQQIVRNAMLHRSYENTNAPVRVYWFNDRVEIHNPGGPYGQVTKQNFGKPGVSDYRNPNLAAVMKELGYVQRFGYGITLARNEMEKNGNPSPDFLVEDAHVAVVLRRHA
ncbi:MAG: putative DNA binding domain-containing protein [Planctomycetes bacterium]|nr:putative DNA binding domain-containing protein [Planctomycetota bacterium]